MLMKTGFKNILLPRLFTIVNHIVEQSYTEFTAVDILNNTFQYFWQLCPMWAAKHCSILLFCMVKMLYCVRNVCFISNVSAYLGVSA